MLNFAALSATPLALDPYEHLVVSGFVPESELVGVGEDFPALPGPGSHPPNELQIKGRFKAVIDDLLSPQFKKLIEQKFNIDLTDRPTMYTVRGFTREKDGEIHTDSETKLITVLLYLNQSWESDVGRLRLLRNGTDLENYALEVPPFGGTMLAFKRSDCSWHGHKPFSGQRRALQLNWVTSQRVADFEHRRHQVSTKVKKVKAFFARSSA